MSEEKQKLLAPMAINQIPFDPLLDDLDASLDAIAERFGYSIVAMAWKMDGKMAVSGHNLGDDKADPLANTFNKSPAVFLLHNAYAMRAVEVLQEEENKAAGKA